MDVDRRRYFPFTIRDEAHRQPRPAAPKPLDPLTGLQPLAAPSSVRKAEALDKALRRRERCG